MTKDEQRDIVLNFFKDRGQELVKLKHNTSLYTYRDETIELILIENWDNGYSIIKCLREFDWAIDYKISNLPTDHKELNVLLNILNPLPE